MFKKIIFVSASLVTALACAQTPYFQSPKKSPFGASQSNVKGVTSPSDFSAQVNKINSQNSANFKQQLDQKIDAIPAPKIQTPPESAFGKSTPPSLPAATPPSKSTPTESETPEIETAAPAPMPEAPAALPQPTPSQPATPAPAAPPAQAAPARTPGYTGFGAGQSTSSPNSNQNNASGGWNIKY